MSVERIALGRSSAIAITSLIVGALAVVYAGTNDLWPFVINGVSDGAIYALAALGLVLTFKTSGILNFAIGAQAAASAYVFYSFRIDAGLPWPIAMALSLLLVGLLGSLVLERLAFWLAQAPPVLRVVAAIGLLVMLQSLLIGIYGPATLPFPQYLPTENVRIADVNVTAGQIIVTVLALGATVGLYLFFRLTRLGAAMQAVVDDPNLLALGATNPVTVRRYAWAIGSSFVSISGMLLAPAVGIDVNQLLLVYIAAFGAAAAGAFSNLAVTFGAAIAIGVLTNVLNDQLASSGTPLIAGFYTQIPFVALVLALLIISPKRLIEKGSGQTRRFQPLRTFTPGVVQASTAAGIAFALALPFLVASSDVGQYTAGLGFAIILLSLGLLVWTSGQISLCHAAFAAVGASTFAHAQQHGTPWLLALAFAMLVALVVGAVVAIPSFRLSGTYLAAITFGAGLLAQNLLYPTFVMFGDSQVLSVDRPDLIIGSAESDRGYYYFCAALTGACALLVVAIRRGRLGRLLRGLAESPAALDAHGARTRLTRLYVFCISAAMAAVGGVVIAGVTTSASGQPTGPFGFVNSLVLVVVLACAGRYPVLSPIVAAFFFQVLKIYPPFDSSFFVEYQGVFFGLVAIAVAVVPGITGLKLHGRSFGREQRPAARGRPSFVPRVPSEVLR